MARNNLETVQLVFAFLFLIFILFFIFFVSYSVGNYFQYKQDKIECNNYNYYGYYTEFVGKWSENWKCLIYLKDGTKIPLDVFKVTSIKEPLTRSVK